MVQYIIQWKDGTQETKEANNMADAEAYATGLNTVDNWWRSIDRVGA